MGRQRGAIERFQVRQYDWLQMIRSVDRDDGDVQLMMKVVMTVMWIATVKTIL